MTPPSAASLPQTLREDAAFIEEYASRIIGPTVALQTIAANARSAAEALERAEEVVIAAGAWCVAERGSEEEAAAEERILVTVAAYYEWKHASRVRPPQPEEKE